MANNQMPSNERNPKSTVNLPGKPYEKRNVYEQIKVRAVDKQDDNDERLYKNMGGRGGGGGGGRGGGGRDFRRAKDTKGTVLRIINYMTKNKLVLLLLFALMITSSACQLAATYRVRSLLDDFIIPSVTAVDKDFFFSGLARQLTVLAVLYLTSAGMSYAQNRTMMFLAQWAVNRIRSDLFEKLQALPLSYFDSHPNGETMSRFTNDTDNILMALEQSFMQFVTSIINFSSTVVLMIILSWRMFIVTGISIGISLFVVKKVGGLSKIMFKNQQASLGIMNGYIEEMIEGLKVVKAFNYEQRSMDEFDDLDAEYREDSKLANFIGMLPMPVLGSLMNVCYAVTAVFGGYMIINGVGAFSVGSLSVYLTYTRQVSQPINMMSNQVVNLMSAIAGAERVFTVMDTPPEIDAGSVTLVTVERASDGSLTETPDGHRTGVWAWKIPADLSESGELEYREVKGDVRFENVDFSYIEGEPVLRDISVYAKPGQKIAFVGSTGAGKTTITNLINRFYEIEGGQITFDGIDVRDIKKAALRSSLGIVLQDINLFTGTVMENIRYGKLDATEEECIEAAKAANAHGFISRLPDGYQTMITGNGQNLSQGQRQLIAIARTAVAKHPVMILDEATSSIDTRTEKQIERGMDALMDNRTVFVIAHRLSTVRNSKAIAVIEHGEIIEKGNHEELLSQEGRYYMLYTGQHELD